MTLIEEPNVMKDDHILAALEAERDRLVAVIAKLEPARARLTAIEEAINVLNGEVRPSSRYLGSPLRSGLTAFVRDQICAAGPDGATAKVIESAAKQKLPATHPNSIRSTLSKMCRDGEVRRNPQTGAYVAVPRISVAA